jgi:hypothetical protein
MKKIFISLFFVIISLFSVAQNKENISYSFTYGYGSVAHTNDFINGINVDSTKINNMSSFSFRVAKQLDGSKAWHHLYNDFTYGIGGFYGHFNYSKNINNPFALYGFMNLTPLKIKRFALKADIAVGFSFWWDSYSKKDNKYNVAVGTPINCYVNFGLNAYYRLNDNLQLYLGGSLTHFSNGAIVKPNKGINVLSPQVGISYNPQKMIFKQAKDTLSYKPSFETLINVYFAEHGIVVNPQKPNTTTGEQDTVQKNYFIYGLQGRFIKELSFKNNIGLGVEVSYNPVVGRTRNEAHNPGAKDTLSYLDRVNASLFLAYEYKINNVSIALEPGYYVYRYKSTYFSRLYERIGMRYRINDNYYCQFFLRAYNFTIADFIELGFGYRIRSKR